MTDGDGQPVNALYGFSRFLGDLLEEAKPEHVAVAFDESLSTSFRNAIYPAYKANREPAPPELKRQFALCRELCRLLGLAEFGSPTHEADDIIGTIAARLRERGPSRRARDPRQGPRAARSATATTTGTTPASGASPTQDIEGQFGVRPERMADFLALDRRFRGQHPGRAGRRAEDRGGAAARLSPRSRKSTTASTGSAALPIRGASKLADRLHEHREAAYFARRLTIIACDMPIEFSLETLRRRKPDLDGLGAFYDRQKFGAALRRQAERLAGH